MIKGSFRVEATVSQLYRKKKLISLIFLLNLSELLL